MISHETQNCWFVIPAFNEGRVIHDALKPVQHRGYQIVVVDDCSSDDTRHIASSAGAWVCRHAINLGQGAALQTGIDFALNHGASVIVTFDSDGQHSLDDAEAMIEALKTGSFDYVLGSRFLGKTENMPTSRRLLLQAATLYTRLHTGMKLTDTHNGLRAMTARGARALNLQHNRMAHASEILDKIAASGLPWREHPCTITYTDYSRAKGQRLSGMFDILLDLYLGRLHK